MLVKIGKCLSFAEGSNPRKESSYSTISTASNAEVPISFDDLVQVETLSTTASKVFVQVIRNSFALVKCYNCPTFSKIA